MLDPLTRQLFGRYPREVGNPSRQVVRNEEDVNRFLTYNEGVKDCFISIYPLSGEVTEIFLDFDRHPGLCDGRTALEDAKKVYTYLVDKGHQVVAIASGKKGIHLHDMLVPEVYTNETEAKSDLYRATLKILEDVFGPIEQGTENDSTGKSVYVYYAVGEGYRILGVDPKIIGDVRRICRIPNTRRPPENNSWCVFLPDNFLEFNWIDIIRWCKSPRYRERVRPATISLRDLPKIDKKIETNPIAMAVSTGLPAINNGFLSDLLRPCIYRAICSTSPRHDARVAAAIDLLRDWSPAEITDMFRGLKWADWDESTTRSQIQSCVKYKSYSCTKLRQIGMCLVEDFGDCPLGVENNG